MTIQSRLALLFTLLTASILVIYAIVIYVSAQKVRESDFYALLVQEATTKANLIFNAEVDKSTLQEIYRNNREIFNEVEVAVYDVDGELLYHDAVDIDFVKETPEMLQAIFAEGQVRFYQEDWQVVGMHFKYKGNSYAVTAAAYDQYGFGKLSNQLTSSASLLLLSILAIYFAGRIFASRALRPVADMTIQVKQISASKLDLRLPQRHAADELGELSDTFNAMLDRLEASFESQRHFVSNISHELRTPLAAIIAELELALENKRDPEWDEAVLKNIHFDSTRLAKLASALFDFAKASYDPSTIAFREVRLDEILLDAAIAVKKLHADYKVNLHIKDHIETGIAASIMGNEYLLRVAFMNIMENACKFSEIHTAETVLALYPCEMVIEVSDSGVGIPPEDVPHVFNPFFRGSNHSFAPGNGIGLPLTKRIAEMHDGVISIDTNKGKGTIVKVSFSKRS